MFKLGLPVVSAAVALLAAVPAARAGDLGDGGYGGRAYGHSQPYYSGQDDAVQGDIGQDDGGQDRYADRNRYRQDDGDDDDRDYDRDNNDDSDDDDVTYEHRREHHATRHYGSTKDDGFRPDPSDVRPYRAGCVQGWQVKRRLIGEGWSNFHLRDFGRGVAVIRATRVHTGRPFELRIDGCTGETLSSRPADFRRYSYRD